jgi:FtsZ-interacting cell division protein YlmF
MTPFEIGQIGLFCIDRIDEKIYALSPDSIKVKSCKSIIQKK